MLTTEDEDRHEPHGGLDTHARREHDQMTLAETGDSVMRHPVEHMVTGALWSTSWRRQKNVYLKPCAESKRPRGHPSRCNSSPKRPLSARGCQQQLHSGDHRDTHTLLRTSGPINCLSHVGTTFMVSSKVIFENRQHPLQHLGRFLVFAKRPVRQCQIVEGDRNLNMTVPIVLHLDIYDAFENVLGLVVVLELTARNAQVCQCRRHLEVFLATVLLLNLQGPLEDVLRLLVLPEVTAGDAQVC